MLDDQSLRFVFKLTIVAYVAVAGASFLIPRLKTSATLLEGLKQWSRWRLAAFSLLGITMMTGSCIGLAGLFFGWSPARWIFAASYLCNISGTLIMPVTCPENRWDAFRKEFEAFLGGLIVAASFVAADVLVGDF